MGWQAWKRGLTAVALAGALLGAGAAPTREAQAAPVEVQQQAPLNIPDEEFPLHEEE